MTFFDHGDIHQWKMTKFSNIFTENWTKSPISIEYFIDFTVHWKKKRISYIEVTFLAQWFNIFFPFPSVADL